MIEMLMKRNIRTAAATAVILAAFAGCKGNVTVLRPASSGPDPVPVKVVTVSRVQTVSSANYVGRVEPSKSAVIQSQYPGTLEEMYAVKGRKVKKGDVLAVLGSETVKSAYDIAKAALVQAEDGYERAQKVYGSGSVTEVRMVEIRTKLEQARAAEKSAAEAQQDCSVKAPFSGVIGEVYVHKGEKVPVAVPMMQILDVSNVEIHFNVPESEYSKVSAGDRAEVEIPALERTVEGTVAVKGITASALSHAYDFTLKSISDTYSLMPGMVCKVRICSEDVESVVVPASAVMTDMEGRYVWAVAGDDTVCKTRVTVGGFADRGVIVTDGLEEGDKVIVEGSRKVSTGMKVIAEEQ